MAQTVSLPSPAPSSSAVTPRPRFVIVLQYHHARYTGGAEIQAWMLATELVRRGWDVHYASETLERTKPTLIDGVTLHSLPVPDSYLRGNREPVAKLLHELQPNVVYTRIFDPYVGWVAAGAPPETFHIWSTASLFDGRAWPIIHSGRRGMSWLDFLRRLPVYLYWDAIARKGRRRANLVLAIKRELQQDLARIGIQAELLHNSHPPVPESDVQNHQGEPVVLWADSIKPLKRPEAYLELARRCRDLSVQFVMLGRVYSTAYQKMIDEATRELPRFRYDGFIPMDQIDSFFRAAHLHVKTSLPMEGFGNTLMQAWLHGVPAVTLEIDFEDRLMNGELGKCARSMDELETAVREMVNHPDQRRTIGAHARDFAVREFDLQINIDRLEAMLVARGVKLPDRP